MHDWIASHQFSIIVTHSAYLNRESVRHPLVKGKGVVNVVDVLGEGFSAEKMVS